MVTILTPEMREKLTAAGWLFESSTRASKVGDTEALYAEFEAISGQPAEEQAENEWFWRRDGQPGAVWSTEGLCQQCGCVLTDDYSRSYGICDDCGE